jgi:hypothetical protein
MASTFQPEWTELRWMTTTFAGSSDPILIFEFANILAIGIPTIPGPITPILRTAQESG